MTRDETLRAALAFVAEHRHSYPHVTIQDQAFAHIEALAALASQPAAAAEPGKCPTCGGDVWTQAEVDEARRKAKTLAAKLRVLVADDLPPRDEE